MLIGLSSPTPATLSPHRSLSFLQASTSATSEETTRFIDQSPDLGAWVLFYLTESGSVASLQSEFGANLGKFIFKGTWNRIQQ